MITTAEKKMNTVDALKRVEDITQTAGYKEAMDDIKHGRVYHAESVEDMMRQILD